MTTTVTPVHNVRISRLASLALLMSPVPAATSVALLFFVAPMITARNKGWEGFGDFLVTGVAGYFTLIGGTIWATVTVLFGAAALWRIAAAPNQLLGRPLAWLAILISLAWLALAWIFATIIYAHLMIGTK